VCIGSKTFLEEMATKRVTIRELARLSGVSVGTVSRALNGYPDVSPATRARVEDLARELDYAPAAAARALVLERSQLIGVFLETGEGHPDLQHPFFHGVLVGLKERIGAAGYDLLLFANDRQPDAFGPDSFLKRSRHHGVDGVVLMGIDPHEEEIGRLLRSEVPCVGVDMEVEGPNASYVISDNASGAALAVRHLAKLGHRRLATITGMLKTHPGRDRLRGYREEVQRQGLEYREDWVAEGDYYFESGVAAMSRLLELDEPPTAVFAASDLMALGAIRAAGAAGVRVPEDVSVVGFDDIPWADHANPPLTTLRQDKQGLGIAAGEALVQRIEDGDEAQPVQTLPVELQERGSTAPPRTS
jgi:LacI family transcriptional regulator